MNTLSQDTSTPDSSHELEKIVGALSKITSRSPEEIKPQLEKFLSQLSQTPAIPETISLRQQPMKNGFPSCSRGQRVTKIKIYPS